MNGSRRTPQEPARIALRHASRELKDVAQPVAVERVWQRLRRSQNVPRPGVTRSHFWFWVTAPSVLAFSAGVWFGTRAERLGVLRAAPELRMSAEPSVLARGPGLRLGADKNPATPGRRGEPADARGGLASGGGPGVIVGGVAATPNIAEWPLEGMSRSSDTRELGVRRESGVRPGETRPVEQSPASGDSLPAELRPLEPGGEHFLPLSSASIGWNESGVSQTLVQDGVLLPGPPPVTVPAVHETASESAWQRSANAGDYQTALLEIKQGGGFEQVLRHASAEQLMLLSDVARATGQAQRALAALRRIVAEYRQDPVAPLAAWSLGTLLEKTGDQAGARRAFATYRVLAPAGEFAEDSLVRELRYAIIAGDHEVASRLAENYHTDFPTGRRRAEVVQLTQKTTRRSLGGADAGAPEVEEATAEDGE